MLVTDKPDNLPSGNDLDKFKVSQPMQGALIEASFVTFAGTSGGMIEDPPDLDDERTYIVKASCKEVKRARRKDNEERVTTVMEITSVFEQGKVPTIASPGSLFEGQDDEGSGGGDE